MYLTAWKMAQPFPPVDTTAKPRSSVSTHSTGLEWPLSSTRGNNDNEGEEEAEKEKTEEVEEGEEVEEE